MNKYQKTIYNLVHLSKADMSFDGVYIDRKQLKQDINVLWELHNKYQELIKTPTEEEIIKEWEALGYSFVKGPLKISLFHKEEDIEIAIWLGDKSYCKAEKNGTDYKWLTFQEHQLLTKTFKMLGWEV